MEYKITMIALKIMMMIRMKITMMMIYFKKKIKINCIQILIAVILITLKKIIMTFQCKIIILLGQIPIMLISNNNKAYKQQLNKEMAEQQQVKVIYPLLK